MKDSKVFKTNIVVSVILIIGFLLTSMFSFQANYKASFKNIEQVSSLTSEGIYYQMRSLFAKPVNISLTMAHDSLLIDHLADEKKNVNDKAYEKRTKNYLNAYKKKYGYDSVFLVSADTKRYYNFNGLDRVLTEDNPENKWYYHVLSNKGEYTIQVDNDEVKGADNKITVFINCKIKDDKGKVVGVVGVGLRVDSLKQMLRKYEKDSNVEASFIDNDGLIQVSNYYTGYQRADWFKVCGNQKVKKDILSWKKDNEDKTIWTEKTKNEDGKSYIVTRYIPELSWHLVVQRKTGELVDEMKMEFYRSVFMIAIVILTVLFVITSVIRNFNRQLTKLMEEKQTLFKKATEQLYDNIYELNITKNCTVGKSTERYFESLGAGDLPLDQGLKVIADKQIREEFREGYVSTFTPKNVLREYEKGNHHLEYDFMITQDRMNYFWMRIDAYIFYSSEDDCIHMFTYRKNIDQERRMELRIKKEAETDEMTGLYYKKAAERKIGKILLRNPDQRYAFFIFDIDNFKQANDYFGHAFGDFVIRKFADILRQNFREEDVLGRIGGDEFVAFIRTNDPERIEEKARELSDALDRTCSDQTSSWKMSASIGVSIVPEDGMDFETLYKNADKALYETKQRGKNGYTLYKSHSS